MDSPSLPSQGPRLLLSPCSSGRRSNSPEFEFWMVRNPFFPEPHLLSADELFVDGVLLPLHLLHLHNHRPEPPDSRPDPKPPIAQPKTESQISRNTIAAENSPLTASKRWTDIFKKGDKKSSTAKSQEDKNKDKEKEKEREKKREKKSQSRASSSAELNINIWPFSRSRSAGNSEARPRLSPGTRKVSSAPCSRSNSAGESKSRKWPSSPGRGNGVHLGRSSPVWQARRGGGGAKSGYTEAVNRSSEKMTSKTRKGDGRVVNLNVPMCNGYRQQLSCRSSCSSNVSSGGSGNLFNLRSLFTKKVY